MKEKTQLLEVRWTNDYDKFKIYEKNREIDYRHCDKKIQESLLLHGWLKTFPMIVDRHGHIRDGQHRFLVAKKLGMEVPFMVVDNFDDDDMFGINNASKRWTYKDFLHYHMMRGDKNAKMLYEIVKEYKLSIRTLCDLCHCNMKNVMNSQAVFRDFDKEELIYKINLINEIVDYIKIKTERIKSSLVTIIEHPQYDHKRFMTKLSYQLDRVHSCTSVGSYIEMFQDIYNWKASEKIIFNRR